MKVLFAVNNEEISETIVKKYQKEYKEIISYKNVYYFNAIIKELQKDKSYDRIIISEELEAFTNTQYSQIDKFIFEKLDSISDEASNSRGEDIPIILICTDRREKSEEMLVKLFGIGIYNALLGSDRSLSNVCALLKKPRLKKEAKAYYRIEAEDVSYQSENENDVSEVEIQNILAHYKRLGKDERKYIESFDNIASQYNEIQLKIICKFLPLNVRAVLEEQSPKYQQLISINSKVSDSLRDKEIKAEETQGTSEKLLETNNTIKRLSNPVIIPSSVNMNSNKKFGKIKNKENIDTKEENSPTEESKKATVKNKKLGSMFEEEPLKYDSIALPKTEEEDEDEEEDVIVQPKEQKRGRGRPRKNPIPENEEEKPKRGRGRPKKKTIVDDNVTLPGFNDEIEESNETILPGFNDEIKESNETILPGFDDEIEESNETILPGFNDEIEENNETMSPGFDDEMEESNETMLPGFNDTIEENNETVLPGFGNNIKESIRYEDVDITNLLSPDKKIACFVGTSKNGTSFVLNNIAEITSQMGIDTAILDTTKNRNSYYIYTKNEETLRKTAMNSVNNLLQGVAKGIQAHRNLTVYTSLPEETEGLENAGTILQTLLQKHSLVLIDCDFNTPLQYFEKTQEIYLVQSFDILTIQPLTAFLRELKSRNILEERKLKIVLNKALKLRGVADKTIIGGMAYYNDPSMSFMTELFDKNTIRYITIPFSDEVYIKYLEGVINCEISVKGYPRQIMQVLTELANVVYPVVTGKTSYKPPQVRTNGFSSSMNSTLDQMKRRY